MTAGQTETVRAGPEEEHSRQGTLRILLPKHKQANVETFSETAVWHFLYRGATGKEVEQTERLQGLTSQGTHARASKPLVVPQLKMHRSIRDASQTGSGEGCYRPAFRQHKASCARIPTETNSLFHQLLLSCPLWSQFWQQFIGAESPPSRRWQDPGVLGIRCVVQEAPTIPLPHCAILTPMPATPRRIGTPAKIAINPVANNNTLSYQFAAETLCNCRT